MLRSKAKQGLPQLSNYHSLLWRVIVFLGLFVLLSGLIGPRIISGNLLARGYFEWYGPLGKMLLFAMLAVGILIYKRRAALPACVQPWRLTNLMWLGNMVGFFALACVGVARLHAGVHGAWVGLTHLGIIASVVFAAVGCVGLATLRRMGQQFWREICSATGAALGFYVLLEAVYASWRLLAGVVLHGVRPLLQLSGIHALVLPPNILLLDKFGVRVAQTCSGVESMALFTALYIFVGLLDYRRLRMRRFLLAFTPALLGLFVCNILRVYALIAAGYYINPHIAFSLFHTYAGMIFFIIYAAIFWKIAYARLVRT